MLHGQHQEQQVSRHIPAFAVPHAPAVGCAAPTRVAMRFLDCISKEHVVDVTVVGLSGQRPRCEVDTREAKEVCPEVGGACFVRRAMPQPPGT